MDASPLNRIIDIRFNILCTVRELGALKSKLLFAGISGDIEDMGDYAAPPVGEECDAGACGTALSATHPPPATTSSVCLYQ